MEILNKLSPAETYLIKEGNTTSLKNLLKYTLTDLILRKILKTEIVAPKDQHDIPLQYISIGANFENYTPKPHEYVFLSAYQKSADLEIKFEDLIKMGYQKAGSEKHFIFNVMIQSQEIAASVKNDFWKRLFVTVSLTPYGFQVRDEINLSLENLEDSYANLVNQNPDAAKAILEKIQGNIFLLNGFEFELLSKIDKELSIQIEQAKSYNSSTTDDTFSLIYFDSFSDSFDSHYDSFDSSGSDDSSGCSGDSGCSGCSGCGGCGGCG